MQSAKQLQKLKHIRKVKAAIRYQEKTNQRLAPIKKENKDTKEYILRTLRAHIDYTKKDIKTARKNAREDWNLGPLRPNRAVGDHAKAYGSLDRSQFRSMDIPKHWYGAKGTVQKRMKLQIPKHILENNWPIVADDRVVIIRGPDKNKIGYVRSVEKETNQIVIKDLNKVWIDSSILDSSAFDDPKQEWERMIPYEDVRLVARYNSTVEKDGVPVDVSQDVIVENIDMARHTTGINPFTLDNDLAIPKDEQVYPETGEVIWHRYIAGTHEKLEWPWENAEFQEKKREEKSAKKRAPSAPEEKKKEGFVATISTSVNRLLGRKVDDKSADVIADTDLPDDLQRDQPPRPRPVEIQPTTWNDDTTRNIVENVSETDQFVPTLVYPPLPEYVIDELRNKYEPTASLPSKDHPDYEERRQDLILRKQAAKIQAAQARQEFIDTMKTPMEVKRDLEMSKKADPNQTQPEKLDSNLLRAIGELMEKKGKGFTSSELQGWKDMQRMNNREPRRQTNKTAEVDELLG